jgi:hypothetical protein
MKRFQPRPYDPNREDTRSKAQKAAGERNFRIFKLRGLYYHALNLTGQRRGQMQRLVDAELKAIGAEPEGQRRETRLKRYETEKES